jgi:hypothetical protein
MTNPNTPPDDSAERFSLIEMDGPTSPKAPVPLTMGDVRRMAAQRAVASVVANPAVREALASTVRQPIPVVAEDRPMAAASECVCPAITRPLSVHGMCPSCNLRRRMRATGTAPASDSNPLGIDTSLAPDLVAENVGLRNTIARLEAKAKLAANVVAGAKVDAAGIFTGFGGLNPLTRAELAAAVADAGCRAEIMPAAKSAHAQAGRAVAALNAMGYVVRAARVPKHDPKDQTIVRSWRAKWTVSAASAAANVGEAFGHVLLVATLTTDDRLVLEGREDLTARVRTDFETACAGEIYAAADVSAWLCGVLVSEYRAARVGGNWYVRARYAVEAERLCTSLSKKWGRDWLLPAIPMATTEQLCAGLVANFIREANAVGDAYDTECSKLATEKKQMGSKRAATLLGEVRSLAERATSFASMFGESHLAELRTRLAAIGNKIAESTDGIAIRFENIFDELRRDAARE